MEVVLTLGLHDFGAYAHVVFDVSKTRATKIFRRRPDAPDEHVRKVFAAEVAAYKIAKAHTGIAPITPDFFGPVRVNSVVDPTKRFKSDDFLLDCAYQMSYVPGPLQKLGTIGAEKGIPLSRLFKDAGILHVCDASVMLDAKGDICCVIDFAVAEYELEAKVP